MAINVYTETVQAQAASTSAGTTAAAIADDTAQVTAYPLIQHDVSALTDSTDQVTANSDPTKIVPEASYWSSIMDKPFNTVDGETLSTEGGVLRFKTGSYKDLTDKPSIEGVALVDDKSFEELGLTECSILDIEKMFA